MLTLQGAKDSTLTTTDSVTLSSASTTSSVDGTTVVVTIERTGGLDQDFDQLAYARQLANAKTDTFVSITEDLVIDTSPSFNKVVAVSSSNATKCSSFTADTTSPTLQTFDMDMDSGMLTLTFSEAVWVDSTFDVTSITLQDLGTSSFTDSYQLTTHTRISNETFHLAYSKKIPAVAVVKLLMGDTDKDAVKSKRSLAASASSTFIVITDTLTKDIASANNTVVAIDSTSAMQAASYTADVLSPSLLSFTLNMNDGTMTFVFDEIVDPSTLSPQL